MHGEGHAFLDLAEERLIVRPLQRRNCAPTPRGTSIGIFPDPCQACTIRGTPLPELSAELFPGPGRLKKREKWKHEKRKKDAKTEAAFL
jgi:hypothetical protein